jgi:hypothetical protein
MADKILSIGLGANTSGLKKDMDNAAAIVKSAGQQMGDAVVQSSDKMSSSSKRAGENLQSAYRAAAREAREAAIQFGETSDRFRIAAQTAGELKDRLDLTNQTIKAFSNDAPVLTATVGVIQGMAGAFSAAQGAAALFGTDSKALQETMVKLQGALALTTGLQGMKGLGDSLQTLGTVLSTKVIPQFTGLFSLIAANPITATVIAITALGAAYIALSDSTDHARQSQASYDFELASASATVADRVRLVTEQNVKLQNVLKAKQSGVNESAIEAEILKSQIDSKQAILDKEKDALKLKAAGNAAEYEANFYASGKVIQLEGELTLLKQLYDETKKKSDLEASINQKSATINSPLDIPKYDKNFFDPKKVKYTGGFQFKIPSFETAELMPKFDLNKIKAELNQDFKNISEYLNDKSTELAARFNEMLNSGLGNILTTTFAKIGDNLGKENDPFENVGNVLLQSLGSLMQQFGAAMLAMGINLALFQESIASLNPFVAIAAGAAMIVAGAALSSAASKGMTTGGGGSTGVSSGSSGGGGGSINAGTFGNGGMNSNFGVLQVGGEIRGNNLLVSVNRSGYERGRVR